MFKVCLETRIEVGFSEEKFKSMDLVNPIISEI